MRKMLNTLYVTTQGAYLNKEGETVVVNIERETKLRLPIHTLSSIVCFGQVTCSPFLLGHCAEKDVTVSFLTGYGRFLARVQGPVAGNVLLRREQYRQADDLVASARLARLFVLGKVTNCRTVMSRAQRDHGEKINSLDIPKKVGLFAKVARNLLLEDSLDDIRGIEGRAANDYFGLFNDLIVAQKDDFVFAGRNRRPPLDRVNCLLSFLYSLLYHDARSALETVGLDPAVGFLHRDRPGRLSLALDLMEEFRPVMADRLALSLINLGQVRKKGFRTMESGAVVMDDDTRKVLLMEYQKRKQVEIEHPFIKEKIPLGMLMFAQAQLLSRYLRGDLDEYPPFIWR
ncbi:CRISPR-associated protein, Cas1 family [Geoalkalibacter ferrihydriticus]|uniref:CRISPR-associated endonuclease Cas1 n=2 Tax=Geoalkalibacter ferrihydriticus TaxID=392333 RepID=A0A0C2DSA8_9BACT|nr:type I-C CRISPR-associated endonuclease Cas1c [Geoalkalibacter ferrihydriticus]KIH76349.1 CRISPR-associated protein Cas1 [Geoalkalibacter ferrihydriticus DSM 17813]SDL19290.1 CRISPR-associated protein, Cas1 family [Geoalkalibacter ferrihydriticus]